MRTSRGKQLRELLRRSWDRGLAQTGRGEVEEVLQSEGGSC